jgi:hypothetical protein
MKLHDKLEAFSNEMQNQLDINTRLKGGDWESFNNVGHIMNEFEYHKAKLWLAIKEDNLDAIKEYSADCANYLVFLCNSYNLLENKEPNDFVIEMYEGIFNKKSIKDATVTNNQTLENKLLNKTT